MYDFRLQEASYTKLDNDKYEVTLDIEAKKLKADTIGNEIELPLDEWVDVGFYSSYDDEENATIMHQERMKFDKDKMNLTFTLDSLPVKAAIDPRRLLIERVYKDNLKSLSEKTK